MNGDPEAALGEDLVRRITEAVDAGFDAQIAFTQTSAVSIARALLLA